MRYRFAFFLPNSVADSISQVHKEESARRPDAEYRFRPILLRAIGLQKAASTVMNENSTKILQSLAIAGYRSFGDEIQHFERFAKINILIGQNNCGKSNVLRFIHDWVAHLNQQPKGRLTQEDRPIPYGAGIRNGALPDYYCDGATDTEALLKHCGLAPGSPHEFALIQLFSAFSKEMETSLRPWFYFAEDGKLQLHDWQHLFKKIDDQRLYPLWSQIANRINGTREQNWVPETIQRLAPSVPSFTCHLIPAIRRIGDKGSTSNEFSGEGIIERLAKLQNPSANDQTDKARFERIGDFLRAVTDNERAEIEIPFDRDTILVRMDGKTLPLGSLGSGIHEVIILAAAATVLENCVICMEEPELHLNPILQKKLVRYLQVATSNQYFITSHSAALMDTPNAEVYHITLVNGTSRVERVTSDAQRSAVCEGLGYHPSDLLQTNCVIWVEGPSDRLYLNWWISSVDQELIEGIHYSIMFYGGRLASHLTGEDIQTFVSEFISLRRLNRRGVILMDSDRPNTGAHINTTKQRLEREFNEGPGHAWITAGREIENYVDPILLRTTIETVHPTMSIDTELGKFDNALKVKNKSGKELQASKIQVATKVVASGAPNFDLHDLRKEVQKLVDFIHESNPRIAISKG